MAKIPVEEAGRIGQGDQIGESTSVEEDFCWVDHFEEDSRGNGQALQTVASEE